MEVAFVILLEGNQYDYIRRLQLKINKLFHTKEALKLEPHITIKYAFEVLDLQPIEDYFKELISENKPFNIKINGINSFETNVVFADVEKNDKLTDLHLKILNYLGKRFFIQPSEFEGNNFHFHSTLAYKDIDDKTFQKIKEELKNENPQMTFTVQKLGIYLKLNSNADWFLYKTSSLK